MIHTSLKLLLAFACVSWIAAGESPVPPPALTLDLGNGISLALAQIPVGKFLMGAESDPKGKRERRMDEPQHEVTLTKSYFIGIHEVTQEQFQQVMGRNPSRYRDHAKKPVEQVSWFDAVDFCNKLSATSKRTVQLPSEAQWEYATRAGTTGWLSWTPVSGDKIDFFGWVSGGSNLRFSTNLVGQLKPNPWGLYDTYGNVFEWCADWYAEYEAKPVSDPSGPATGACRVKRGGSFHAGGHGSYSRYANRPETARHDIGFRIVVVE